VYNLFVPVFLEEIFMFSVQSVGYVVFGMIACFMGYSMFRSLLPLWGFIVVGWLVMTVAPIFIQVPASQAFILRVAAFIIGGLVGAAVAIPLYYVIVFLSGAALGALVGIIIGAILDLGGVNSLNNLDQFTALTFPPQPNSPLQFFIMIVLGLLLGATALTFQKFMITASSAFLGSAALIGAFSGAITRGLVTSGPGILLIMAWFLLGFTGLFLQYRFMDEDT
jgi:hypothetical protein